MYCLTYSFEEETKHYYKMNKLRNQREKLNIKTKMLPHLRGNLKAQQPQTLPRRSVRHNFTALGMTHKSHPVHNPKLKSMGKTYQ